MRKANRSSAPSEGISLNKYISDTGFCSRRQADAYIDQGRVTINDQVAISGNRVLPGDVVEVDGEPIGRKQVKAVYLAYHKPQGITSTTDTRDRTNIIDAVSHQQRIFPIGRLDKDSEGLIFLTNDGNIVNKILRAGNRHEKEYIVTVDQPHTPDFLRQMASGVRLQEDGWTLPCKVTPIGKNVFRIVLTQGLNRQIRRMCDALGFKVTRLKRVRIMNVSLGDLKPGQWRNLNPEEIKTIQAMVADSGKTEEASVLKREKIAPFKNRTASPEGSPAQKRTPAGKGKSSPSQKTGAPQKDNKQPSKTSTPGKGSYKSYRERRK